MRFVFFFENRSGNITACTSDWLLTFPPGIYWSYPVKYRKLPVNVNPDSYTISTNKQLINAVTQCSYKCAETSEQNFSVSLTYLYVYNIQIFRQHVIKTNPSKFDERYSQKYVREITFETGITRLQEIQDFIFRGREFQRNAPAKDMLVLNRSSLGLGT